MNWSDPSLRLGAVLLLLGTLLFGIATAFHPPTFDPNDPLFTLVEATEPRWPAVHTALWLSVLLLYPGITTVHVVINHFASSPRVLAYSLYALFAALGALVLWQLLFIFEATGWLVLAHAVGDLPGQPTLLTMAHVFWAPTLASGYVAALLTAVAILLWSVALLDLRPFPRWFSYLGIVGALVTMLSQPLAWKWPALALWLLLPGSALLGVWLVVGSWFLWHLDVEGKTPTYTKL